MQTRKKWFAIVFVSLHVFFNGIFDLPIYIQQGPYPKYEVIGALIVVPAFLFELPFWFLKYLLQNAFMVNVVTIETTKHFHFIFTYIFGSVLYFFIGIFISWLFQHKKQKYKER